MLRRVGSPLHVAFAIGGSRCGKSTACNALLLGADAGDRSCFETGSAFDPVTIGVDVAARRLPGGGALVLADCEGAFHLCGSTLNARGFGDVGFLAYHLSSTVIHVSMGSIDERDLEALGHLATDAAELRCDAPECLRPDASPPELLLLVNGARFELGDAVARRLLQPPLGSGRQCARSAIARAFGADPSLEALPSCENWGYWPKVERLREQLLEVPPVVDGVLQASGSQVARRLEALVAHLAGVESPAAGPVSAAEHSLRSRLLDPLVEEIAKKFTTAASSWRPNQVGSPCSADAREDDSAVEEALLEFDERSAWLSEAAEDEAAALPAELLRAVRERLAARLQGIAEAVARGRQESAALRRQGSASRRDRGTPSRLELSPGSLEFRTPTPPQTPSRRRTLAALLGAAEEAVLRVEAFHLAAEKQAKELREIFGEATIQAAARSEAAEQEDSEAAEEVTQWQEEWERRFSQEASTRQRAECWTAKCQELVDDLSSQLHSLEGKMPDVLSGAVVLERVRSDLEVMRIGRREVSERASKRIAAELEELRDSCAFEASGHADLSSRISREMEQRMAVLQELLEEESSQRRERHQALVEVVAQMSKSLEATMLSEEDGQALTPSPASHAKSLRTPGGRWKSEKLTMNGLLRRRL